MHAPQGQWPFDTVLIANRGEIALRVIRTVHALGLRAAVVFHAADGGSPAVAAADAAVEITGETPVAAYLDGTQIVEAARKTGAGAIHPGYGFLSENAEFARTLSPISSICSGLGPTKAMPAASTARARIRGGSVSPTSGGCGRDVLNVLNGGAASVSSVSSASIRALASVSALAGGSNGAFGNRAWNRANRS